MKIEKYNIIQCVGIVLLALILIIMGYTIKSKQEQIEALESANTSLQGDIERASINYNELNEKYVDKCAEMVYNQSEREKEECLHFLKLIELIKDQDKYVWFQLYYNALFNIYELDDLPETPYDVFTEREITMMLKCIETETHEASFDCKVNVANVILNRVESEQFPTDPVELITQNNQFAYGRDNISDSTVYALLYAYMIGSEETNNCIGFRSDKKVENWNDWEYSYYDGVHWFYKLKE